MSDLGLNVVKLCYAYFTFLQHLTPTQIFITSKKIIITTQKRKKVAKSLHARGLEPRTFRAADT